MVNITNGGMVVVSTSRFNFDLDEPGGSSIDMASGGMLAIRGDADDSISDFLSLINGDDPIRYWNGTAWSSITNGTEGVDYFLEYVDPEESSSHTILTVAAAGPPPAVPEPSTLALATMGLLAFGFTRWRRRASRLAA